MASKAQRIQYLTIGLCEGFVDMLWLQEYKFKKKNKTFITMSDNVKNTCKEINTFLKKNESGGGLAPKDLSKIGKAVDEMKANYLIEGKCFTKMMGLAIAVDMVVYQIHLTNGTKQKLFEKLLAKMNYLVKYFDKSRKWEDKDDLCLRAAENLRGSMEK
jgi:hypothetical protein